MSPVLYALLISFAGMATASLPATTFYIEDDSSGIAMGQLSDAVLYRTGPGALATHFLNATALTATLVSAHDLQCVNSVYFGASGDTALGWSAPGVLSSESLTLSASLTANSIESATSISAISVNANFVHTVQIEAATVNATGSVTASILRTQNVTFGGAGDTFLSHSTPGVLTASSLALSNTLTVPQVLASQVNATQTTSQAASIKTLTATSITSQQVNSTLIAAQQIVVSSLTFNGDTTLSRVSAGVLSTASLQLSGTLTAASAAVSGGLTSATASISGTLTAASAAVSGTAKASILVAQQQFQLPGVLIVEGGAATTLVGPFGTSIDFSSSTIVSDGTITAVGIGKFQVSRSGVYMVAAQIYWTTTPAAGSDCQLYFTKVSTGGTTYFVSNASPVGNHNSASGVLWIASGDTLIVNAWVGSGTYTVYGAGNRRFSIQYLNAAAGFSEAPRPSP